MKNSVPSISLGNNKKVLYLTKNPILIKRQLQGEDLGPFPTKYLLDRVSTDTYPTRSCFRYDEDYMASQALTGLHLGNGEYAPQDSLKNGHFGVIIAGHSFGCGSSREHFPMSLKAAGIKLIIAESIEPICAQNCQNIGLLYIQGEKAKLARSLLFLGKDIPLPLVIEGLDEFSAKIICEGGLFSYFKDHTEENLPLPQTEPRAMTAAEKIIAKHMGVKFVKPGDVGFVKVDRRYSYEIFLPFSYHIFREQLTNAEISDPQSIYLFYDHSVLDNSPNARSLAEEMRKIAKKERLTLYDGNRQKGVEGICHIIMLNKHALPGEIVAGTDSHTCTLGAIGVLPLGVGATEWAAALWNKKIRLTVPTSLKITLKGTPPQGVMAKDIMLHILSLPYIAKGKAVGKIFEFSGETFNYLPIDEQIVFANMSVEGGASTSFNEPNQQIIEFVQKQHQLSSQQLNSMLYYPDKDAEYDYELQIEVNNLEPYIALPGSPRNSIPLSAALKNKKINKKIQKAFIGSCTGGKYEDILRAVTVLEGRKIHPDVKLYVQPSSRDILKRIYKEGLAKIIEDAGGLILPPGCGACVNFGPGAVEKGEQGVSSTNRNFPGRMGQGLVFLTNPEVVAASAVAGEIISPTYLKPI